MAKVKVQFACRVKYNGTFYPAYTPILADEEDLPQMKKQGAFVIQEQAEATSQEETTSSTKTTKRTSRKSGRLND